MDLATTRNTEVNMLHLPLIETLVLRTAELLTSLSKQNKQRQYTFCPFYLTYEVGRLVELIFDALYLRYY